MERPGKLTEYEQYLENKLNGSTELEGEIRLTMAVWAEDLRKIREGRADTKYIGVEKKSRGFEQVMVMIKQIADVRAFNVVDAKADEQARSRRRPEDYVMNGNG